MHPETEPILSVENLEIRYAAGKRDVVAVADVSFRLERGECFGLVGESGCGKSTIAIAIMRYLGSRGRIANGTIVFRGQDLASLDAEQLRAVRGKRIAMVYQDASTALNPTMTIGAQLREVLSTDAGGDHSPRERVIVMLHAVGIPDPEGTVRRFPHQISGGQQQRVVIAMAFLAEPDLLILDEPTTALDVTVEAQIMDLLAAMQAQHGTTMLFISHNLALVRRMCDRVGVMYAGQIVEQGSTETVLGQPRHPYTRGLLSCIPRLDRGRAEYRLKSIAGQVPRLHALPTTCIFIERCPHARADICGQPIEAERMEDGREIRCRRWNAIPAEAGIESTGGSGIEAPAAIGKSVLALDHVSKVYEVGGLFSFGKQPVAYIRANSDVSFELHAGETLGIVGESGCGKSTLARIIMGLDVPSDGRIALLDSDVTGQMTNRRTRDQIRNVQMVFQNPDSTLNPSHSVGFILERAVKKLGTAGNATERRNEVLRLLDLVRLPREVLQMSASRLSGGQKQRVAVARAFAGRPSLVVADEPTSALDTSVKTAILELLLAAQKDAGTALIFISHDLAVVRYVADRVAVMYGGRIVELGDAAQVFTPPYHPYCEALLSSAPGPDGRAQPLQLHGEVNAQALQTAGCVFAARCPRIIEGLCRNEPPPLRQAAPGHAILCHHTIEALRETGPMRGPAMDAAIARSAS